MYSNYESCTTYSKAGKYTVSLTVKNAKGSNTKTMAGYFVVSKKMNTLN
ncbi:PKD domain-containing protein [Methanosarcina sp. UBA411]|jgi:PKD repeat protein